MKRRWRFSILAWTASLVLGSSVFGQQQQKQPPWGQDKSKVEDLKRRVPPNRPLTPEDRAKIAEAARAVTPEDRARFAEAMARAQATTKLRAPAVLTRPYFAKVQRTLSIGPTFWKPTPIAGSTWSNAVCNNHRWMQGTDFEWTQVLGGAKAIESVVGVSGIVINEHVSGEEVWYTHPFGSDWNMNLAVDPGYEFVFAPGTPQNDQETKDAVMQSQNEIGIPVTNALHVEMDSGFLPNYYRATTGQDVVVFGRWIIDCGHTNFTSEIHPPLILAKASGDDQVNGVTRATVISRPYLVLQTFNNGKTLYDQMLQQVIEIYTFPDLLDFGIFSATFQPSARPDISTIPLDGAALVPIVIRPQYARISPNDRLLFRGNLYVRPGVAVEPVNNGDDSITVWVFISDNGYQPARLPPSQNVHHPLSQIRAALPDVGSTIDGILGGGFFSPLNPFGDAVLAKGFDTDSYQMGTFVEAPLGNFSENLRQSVVVETSTTSVYPIIGTIELKWERH
jgi:hypothetical protein